MLSSTLTRTCRCPFSNSILKIPSTNYTHTMSVGIPEASPNAELKAITVELQVQGWDKLYVEPTRGCPLLTMEDFLPSPKFTCNFKLPLFLSTSKRSSDSYVGRELGKLPISPGLAQYLKPFIVNGAFVLGITSHAEFKLVFDVKVVKIDLANYRECDRYRRRGLV